VIDAGAVVKMGLVSAEVRAGESEHDGDLPGEGGLYS
jgi:hypothetical protein